MTGDVQAAPARKNGPTAEITRWIRTWACMTAGN